VYAASETFYSFWGLPAPWIHFPDANNLQPLKVLSLNKKKCAWFVRIYVKIVLGLKTRNYEARAEYLLT